jgi:hypothetical protein
LRRIANILLKNFGKAAFEQMLPVQMSRQTYECQKGHEGLSQTLLDVIGRLAGEGEEEDDAVVSLVHDGGEGVAGEAVEV